MFFSELTNFSGIFFSKNS